MLRVAGGILGAAEVEKSAGGRHETHPIAPVNLLVPKAQERELGGDVLPGDVS